MMRGVVRVVMIVLSCVVGFALRIAEAQQPTKEGRFQLLVAATVNQASTEYDYLAKLVLNKKRVPEPGGLDPMRAHDASQEDCMRPRLYKIDTATGDAWVETFNVMTGPNTPAQATPSLSSGLRIVRAWEPFNITLEVPKLEGR